MEKLYRFDDWLEHHFCRAFDLNERTIHWQCVAVMVATALILWCTA